MNEQITIRLPKELLEQLKQEAHHKGMEFNAFVLKKLHCGRETVSPLETMRQAVQQAIIPN